MQKKRGGLRAVRRIAALALVCAACGCCCLQLCTGTAADLWRRAGLLGLTFAGAPQAAGRTLALWLAEEAQTSLPQTSPAAPPAETAPSQQDAADAPSAPADALQEEVLVQQELPAAAQPDWLPVREVCYPASGEGERYIALAAGSIRNLTSYSAAELRNTLAQPGLPFSVKVDSDEPQVLIMHTHTTEGYAEADGWVDPANNGRTTDTAANMAAVGAELAAVLNAAGICTVQDTTLHDYPSYNGSYGRSRVTVEEWLAAYPSICIVLDVHRDAIETDGTRIKPTALIDGQKAAQLMIISGADDGTMGMPEFRQNLRFAAALQSAVEGAYPGLTRPVLFDYRNYNQQLTTGSLLLEIGGHGNTLEEAKYTARLVGQALAALLHGNA